jgi:endonuclease/exonuclease/phosphatase family metal-dependent hydrolase
VLALLALAPSPAARAAAAPLMLRVVTWNVWGVPMVSAHLDARMRALPDAIASLAPDIVLLQELWRKEDGVRVVQGLERHGYRYTQHVAITERGRTGLFIASRFPLQPADYHPFAIGRFPHSFWHLDWLVSKGVATWAVETPLGELLVQNTHLQAQYSTDKYAAERLSQVTEIVLLNRARWDRPLITAGDFNSRPRELPRTTLRDLGGWMDAAPTATPDTVYVRNGGGLAIRVAGVRSAFIQPMALPNGDEVRWSDHAALVVDLEIVPDAGAPAARVAAGEDARAATVAALRAAAALTPGRITRMIVVCLGLVGLALLLRRSRLRPALRIAALALLAFGFVWSACLAVVYYPHYGATLREAARTLEESPR